MALSIIVGIPDLPHMYIEPMETASSNLHASGLTYSPQGCCIHLQSDAELPGGPSQLSHYLGWKGVMPWPCP